MPLALLPQRFGVHQLTFLYSSLMEVEPVLETDSALVALSTLTLVFTPPSRVTFCAVGRGGARCRGSVLRHVCGLWASSTLCGCCCVHASAKHERRQDGAAHSCTPLALSKACHRRQHGAPARATWRLGNTLEVGRACIGVARTTPLSALAENSTVLSLLKDCGEQEHVGRAARSGGQGRGLGVCAGHVSARCPFTAPTAYAPLTHPLEEVLGGLCHAIEVGHGESARVRRSACAST